MNRRQQTRNRILDSAISEFNRTGVDATTMERIASGAGFTKRTLYKYFPQKTLIVEALLDNLLDEISSTLTIPYNADQDFEEHLIEVIDCYVNAFSDVSFIEGSKVIIQEMIKGRKLNDSQTRKYNTLELSFSDWIDNAKKDDRITSAYTSDEILKQFYSLLKGEIYYPLLYGTINNSARNRNSTTRVLVKLFTDFYCSQPPH